MADANEAWYTEDDNNGENGWNRLQDEFSNIGYREGITNGKESALQEGFDAGFAQIGAPFGRQLGIMRGIINALRHFLQTNEARTLLSERFKIEQGERELNQLSDRLNRVRLRDLAPLDLEEQNHAREHRDIDIEGSDDALATSMMNLDTTERPNGVAELAAIQLELRAMLQRLSLTNTLLS